MEIVKTENIKECLEIRFTVFVNEQKVPVELEVDEYDNDNTKCDHFIIQDNGKNVGTFRCIYDAPTIIHMQRLCVLKEMRSKGYGYAAMQFIKDYYGPLGVNKITLNAQCHAIPFYESCGFEVVSDIFDDAGIPHRTMEQNI